MAISKRKRDGYKKSVSVRVLRAPQRIEIPDPEFRDWSAFAMKNRLLFPPAASESHKEGFPDAYSIQEHEPTKIWEEPFRYES